MSTGSTTSCAPEVTNAINFDRLTRLDHRKLNQIRLFSCEQGILHQADGAARFTHGHTSVLTAVYGPMTCTRTSQELIEGCFVEVIFNSAVDDDVQRNKECSELLRRTFEPIILRSLQPRALLRIVVQVIKDDGSVLAAATNSVCMALMDAGFPMKTFAVGMSCLMTENSLTIDPTSTEEQDGQAVKLFAAFDGNNGDILTTITSGIMSDDTKLLKAIDTMRKATNTVVAFMRIALEQKYPVTDL